MKRSILALALLPLCANALEFEVGTGATHYKKAHDGLWWQGNHPATEDLQSVPMSLGVSAERNGIRYRAEYIYLGWMYNSGLWVSDADNYPGSTATPTLSGIGRGSVAGLIFSASRPVPVFGIPFYAEAGVFAYVPKYKMTVTDRVTGEVWEAQTTRSWRFGPALGVGIRYSGVDVSVKYLGMNQGSSESSNPPIYDHAYVLETKVYF